MAREIHDRRATDRTNTGTFVGVIGPAAFTVKFALFMSSFENKSETRFWTGQLSTDDGSLVERKML